MSSPKPSKKLLKKLKKSSVYVEDSFGVAYRVPPVKELRDPIERFLPPPGQYYDQNIFESSTDVTDNHKKCVLCGNVKGTRKECKCTQCAMCGKKHNHRTGCPRVYATIKWWESHGNHLSKKTQLRPNPGERAYLVVAGVLKDWKKLEDPVVVNMQHPDVKAFYKGKKAPSTLAFLPEKLLSTSAAATAKPSNIRWIDEPDADEGDLTVDRDLTIDLTPRRTSTQQRDFESIQNQVATTGTYVETRDVRGGIQVSVRPEEGGSLLNDALERSWQSPSYHEGTRRAAVTPLSIRLALNTAQGFATSRQTTASTGNEVRPDLDPRLKARAQPRSITSTYQSSLASNTSQGSFESTEKCRRKENECDDCREELLKAFEEIRAKDRRIRELELSLHEAEGWTDAATYQQGQKRPRA